jgi:fimbrial chaperone protein
VPLFEGGGPRSAFAILGLGLALCRAEAVFASTFRVSPVQVSLSPAAPTALLTVGNDSDETLRFQVSAFSWDQDATGRMQLTPTRDVVFFPMMLTLGPGEARKIRVGSTLPAGAVERTFRLFVEELPQAAVARPDSEGAQIRVLTKLGIPLFIQPSRPKPEASIEIRGVSGDRLRFVVRNTGNAHFLLQDLRIRGMASAGQLVLDRKAEGWYVLAGGEREYEQPLSANECADLRSVAIEGATDRGSLAARLDLLQPACESSAMSTASRSSE